MADIEQIDEEKFASFLKSLGVETKGVSFGWILDEDKYGILRWIFENISYRTALNERETYRFLKLQEESEMPPFEVCLDEISKVQSKYKGITLPGDNESLAMAELKAKQLRRRVELLKKQEAKLDSLIEMNRFNLKAKQLRRRVELLKKQEAKLDSLIEMNSLAKEDVKKQISAYKEDESCAVVNLDYAKERCTKLSDTVEKKISNLTRNIAEYFKFYSDFHIDKTLANHLMVSGPLKKYMHGRQKFQSHYAMYTTRQFSDSALGGSDVPSRRTIAVQALEMENRLHKALLEYLESVCELNGIYTKTDTVQGYTEQHSSQLGVLITEYSAEIELLKHEYSSRYTDDQLSPTVARGVVVEYLRSVLEHRKKISADISELSHVLTTATSLDKLLYVALKMEHARLKDFISLATEFKKYFDSEITSVNTRMELMSSIEKEIKESNEKLKNNNFLKTIMDTMLDQFHRESYPEGLNGLQDRVIAEFDNFGHVLDGRMCALKICKEQSDKTKKEVSECTESLSDGRKSNLLACETETKVDNQITTLVQKYLQIKNNKNDLNRKLWQWFLCDEKKFLSTFEDILNRPMDYNQKAPF